MKKALFLDRDGVVNKDIGYLHKIKDFQFIDGVFETCQFFQSKGFIVIIITNQSGIARGYYSEQEYKDLTDWMLNQFRLSDVYIDQVYYCPHHPDIDGFCECRKPMPGMILKAQRDFDIDLHNSILVGDKKSDMDAAKSSGINNRLLVKSGHALSKDDLKSATEVLESVKLLPDWYKKNMEN